MPTCVFVPSLINLSLLKEMRRAKDSSAAAAIFSDCCESQQRGSALRPNTDSAPLSAMELRGEGTADAFRISGRRGNHLVLNRQ